MQIHDMEDMPSEIYDSFEGPLDQQVEEQTSNAEQTDSKESIEGPLGSSLADDDFLEQFKKGIHGEQKEGEQNTLLVDKTKIELTIMPYVHYEQKIKLTNTSSAAMKVRASSNQLRLSYGANQQDGAEIVLDCYDSLEVIVHIEKSHEEYGDLFDSITIHSKHLPDLVLLPNIYIELTVHFVSPKIRFGFDGFSCTAYMPESPVTVCRIKPNKLGEYVMTVIALEGLSKIQCSLETRGRISVHPESLNLYRNQQQKIFLRQRGANKQRTAVVLRLKGTKLCYVIGIELLN